MTPNIKNKQINPWKILNSRYVYKNDWMRLREDQVITPGGKKGIYGVVETSPAIAIVPITDCMETYLIGQYRYTLDTYSWEVPEGGAEINESYLEAAQRELKEETGLRAEKWTYLGSLYTSNSITNEIGHIYLAEELFQEFAEPEHTEELEIKKLPFIDAYQMVIDHDIKDALAIVAMMRVHHYLKFTNRLK